MIELDGDEERISSQGRYAERDIVQVCPLSRLNVVMYSMINEEMRPLGLRCSAVHLAVFLLTQSWKLSSPFALCPFYPALVCPCD